MAEGEGVSDPFGSSKRWEAYDSCKRLHSPSALALYSLTKRPGGYHHVEAAGLSNLPYVCLRVPTGGGKTLLACHAAGIAMKELLHADRSVVLWLVPSNTILDQTADALRDTKHPYRRALEMEFGAVEVMTIEEALRLSRATVEGQTVVIVSTIQCFRVEDTRLRPKFNASRSAVFLKANWKLFLFRLVRGFHIPSICTICRKRQTN